MHLWQLEMARQLSKGNQNLQFLHRRRLPLRRPAAADGPAGARLRRRPGLRADHRGLHLGRGLPAADDFQDRREPQAHFIPR